MLFFIFIAMVLIGALISFKASLCSIGEILGECMVGIGGFAILVSLIVLCINYGSATSDIESNKQCYEILTYQIQTQMYNNDNEYGKEELMENVQDWNENLASNKAIQKSFMFGIYVPNIYDQFEFIDYSSVK